jgi:hypothetical protein
MRGIVVVLCVLSSLACGAAAAQAEGVVPIEGSWTATTAAGLPVSFEVKEGQVLNARFKFRWGFCGSFESAERKSVPIDAAGHWKYPDLRGPWIEGTFLAADRVEGTVSAPSRMLPGCPETHSTFVAMPGEPIPIPEPEVRVKDDITGDHFVKRPHKIVLSADGSFYLRAIKWQSFGGRVGRATAVAYTRAGCPACSGRVVVKRPRVKLRLTNLMPRGRYSVYALLHYVLLGPVPPGFAHRASLSML